MRIEFTTTVSDAVCDAVHGILDGKFYPSVIRSILTQNVRVSAFGRHADDSSGDFIFASVCITSVERGGTFEFRPGSVGDDQKWSDLCVALQESYSLHFDAPEPEAEPLTFEDIEDLKAEWARG